MDTTGWYLNICSITLNLNDKLNLHYIVYPLTRKPCIVNTRSHILYVKHYICYIKPYSINNSEFMSCMCIITYTLTNATLCNIICKAFTEHLHITCTWQSAMARCYLAGTGTRYSSQFEHSTCQDCSLGFGWIADGAVPTKTYIY